MEGSDYAATRLRQLELVHTVSRELHNALDAEALLPRVLSIVLGAVDAEAGSLWLLRGETITCVHAAGGAGDSIVGLELPRGAGVVGSVADRRRPEVVLDASQDKRHLQQVDKATGFVARSMITVPLLVRGECLGALQVLNKKGEGGRFTREDAEVVSEIAVDAAAVVRNAQLLRTERRAKEMQALLRMSREITSTLDMDRILTTAANVLTGIVRFDRCAVALQRSGGLQVTAVSGVEKPDRADPGVAALEGLLRWLGGFQATLYSPSPEDAEEEEPERAARFRAHAEATGMKAVLAVPLRDDSGFIGMLSMEAREEEFLEEGQQEVVETFANQVAVALRNADLYRQTPLVGFLGRRGGGGGGLATAARRWSPRAKATAAAAGALLLLSLIPLPRHASGEAEVVPVTRHRIRPDTSQVVESITVEEGQAVKAGDELGRLRSVDLEVERADILARLRSAGAEAARHEAAGRVAEERASREQVRWLEAQLEVAERRLATCVLRAPVDGLVLTHRPRDLVGTVAEPGKTLLEVAEDGRWVVETRVPQGDILLVAAGQETSFSTPAVPGGTFRGTVASLGVTPAAGTGDPTFPVTGTVEDPAGRLRPGMKGRGHVRVGTRSVAARVAGGLWNWFRRVIG